MRRKRYTAEQLAEFLAGEYMHNLSGFNPTASDVRLWLELGLLPQPAHGDEWEHWQVELGADKCEWTKDQFDACVVDLRERRSDIGDASWTDTPTENADDLFRGLAARHGEAGTGRYWKEFFAHLDLRKFGDLKTVVSPGSVSALQQLAARDDVIRAAKTFIRERYRE